MPLKIRVKPEGKIFVGGTIIKNAGTKPADLLILSDTPVLREDYLVNMDRKDDSDAGNVYFLLQVLYLYKGKKKPLDKLVIETVKNFGKMYPSLLGSVEEILQLLESGESFRALQVAHDLLDASKSLSTSPQLDAGEPPPRLH